MDKKYQKLPYLGKGTNAKNFWVSYHRVNSLKVHANFQNYLPILKKYWNIRTNRQFDGPAQLKLKIINEF